VRYVALLRGIGPLDPNMRNEKLRGVIQQLGYRNVETVMSSGNVLFDARAQRASTLEARIEKAWPQELGFSSTTIVRSRDEIRRLLAKNPFGDLAGAKGSNWQVTFLKREPAVAADHSFNTGAGFTVVSVEDRAICAELDGAEPSGRQLMRWIETTFGKEITTRTWKTVQRIARKL
jgi:uncharacterized protein (DUF1697 family)